MNERHTVEFNEAWMQPGGNYGHRAPETSRKQVNFVSPRVAPARKGLARCELKAIRLDSRTWDIVLAANGRSVATVTGHGKSHNKSYAYKLVGEAKPHGGFASMTAALKRLAEKL